MPEASLFSRISQVTRFWLPPLLADLSKVPPTLTNADNCSIFVKDPEQEWLWLAATTRSELRGRLFQEDSRYSTNLEQIRRASELFYSKTGRLPEHEGVTAWVGATETPLQIRNLHSKEELQAIEPFPPVWSYKHRALPDDDDRFLRPMLIVPMHHEERLVGVVRVTSSRTEAVEFRADAMSQLQSFADSLGPFLSSARALEPEAKHYFQIWCAQNREEAAERITQAVPSLVGAGHCSLFLRDTANRFVLQKSSNKEFEDANRSELYYTGDASDGSKTGLAIRLQSPISIYRDGSDHPFKLDEFTTADIEPGVLDAQSGGQYISETLRRDPPKPHCELPAEETSCIICVPVNDVISPYKRIAGILRVPSEHVSQADDESAADARKRIMQEVDAFANDLASVIAGAWTEGLQREARRKLIARLGEIKQDIQDPEKKTEALLCAAAEITCDALEASGASIFLRNAEGVLETRKGYVWLAHKLYAHQNSDFRQHFENEYQLRADRLQFERGEGATGRAYDSGTVLNLRDVQNAGELEDAGGEPSSRPECYEVANPGPFLAAPLFIDDDEIPDGVIRVVRRKETSHGPFSLWHETVLETCAGILAEILRTVRARAIISYSESEPDATRFIEEQLNAMGVLPIRLVTRNRQNESYEADFRAQAKRADFAILHAVRDPKGSGRLSDAQEFEYTTILNNENVPCLVLRQDLVELLRTPRAIDWEIPFDTGTNRPGIQGISQLLRAHVEKLVAQARQALVS